MKNLFLSFKDKNGWLFEEWTLDKKQEVIINHILTYCNLIFICYWQLAKDHGIRFFETSAKSSINVDEVSLEHNHWLIKPCLHASLHLYVGFVRMNVADLTFIFCFL